MGISIREHVLPWVDSNRTITPTAIVLHWWEEPIDTAKGVTLLEELWQERGLASQFAVLVDGTIYRMTPHENSFSRHAKCANESAIGIEIQGLGAEDLRTHPLQFDAVVRLTRYLKQKYLIEDKFRVEGSEQDESLRFFGVTSHKNVDKYCSLGSGKVDVDDDYLARVVEAIH